MLAIERLEELSWPGGGSAVWRLEGRFGAVVLKVQPNERKFAQELRAYRRWLPQLAELLPAGVRVPRLLADRTSHLPALLLTAEPGRVLLTHPVPRPVEGLVHERAGAFARALHHLGVPDDDPLTPAEAYAARFAAASRRARSVLPGAPVLCVGERVSALLPFLHGERRVAVHNDFSPRNWLADASGHVTVIDFEHSRTDVFLAEFLPLWASVWPARPDLRAAFFRGYGRELSEAEERALAQLGALWGLVTATWGREHGDNELAALGALAMGLAGCLERGEPHEERRHDRAAGPRDRGG